VAASLPEIGFAILDDLYQGDCYQMDTKHRVAPRCPVVNSPQKWQVSHKEVQRMGVLENMKEVADLVKKVGDIDLNRKIVALEGEVQDLTRAKRQLETRVEEQDRIIQLRKDLKFKEPFYYLEGDETPYCPGCFEGLKHLAVHVVFGNKMTNQTRWDCPFCQHTYLVKEDKNYQAPTQVRPFSGGRKSWMS
jgi:hypothetical protein